MNTTNPMPPYTVGQAIVAAAIVASLAYVWGKGLDVLKTGVKTVGKIATS